jgi:hypothetical protein
LPQAVSLIPFLELSDTFGQPNLQRIKKNFICSFGIVIALQRCCLEKRGSRKGILVKWEQGMGFFEKRVVKEIEQECPWRDITRIALSF